MTQQGICTASVLHEVFTVPHPRLQAITEQTKAVLGFLSELEALAPELRCPMET